MLGLLACLLRPEVFPFLAAYGLWLWFAEPAHRRLTVGVAVALPLLWLVPEWIGSGQPAERRNAGAQRALVEPVARDRPWLEALERAHALVGLQIELAVLAAAAFGGLAPRRWWWPGWPPRPWRGSGSWAR